MFKNMNNKKRVAAVALAGAMVMGLGASMAYFTDRADTNATGTAGTVAIYLNPDVNLLDADGKDIINPGDLRDASFRITNEGNKSIDVRETLILECFDKDGNALAMTAENGQAQYELYKREDVEQDANGSWKPKAGKEPLTVRTADLANGKITYAVPQYTLNGSSTGGKSDGVGFSAPAQNVGEENDAYATRVAEARAAYIAANAEDNTKREIEDDITSIAADQDFVLIMRGTSDNTYQHSQVKLSVLAEAKQHRNTGDDTWTSIKSESITFGGASVDVVNPETAITNGNFTAVTP